MNQREKKIRKNKKHWKAKIGIKFVMFLFLMTAGILTIKDRAYCMEVVETVTFETEGTCLKKYLGTDTIVTIPQGITKIGEEAFKNNQTVLKIIIPQGVTKIEKGAFYKCSNLTTITLPTTLTEIGNYTFARCPKISKLMLPESVTQIGVGAFYEMKSLKSLVLPKNLTTAANIFGKVSYIQKVKFAPGTNIITEYIFRNATTLKTVSIPGGVTTISKKAFQNCTSLTQVKLPNSVIRVSGYAFHNCISLGLFKIGKKEITFGKGAFLGATKVYFQGYNHSTAKIYAKKNQIKFKYLDSEVIRMKKQKALYKTFKSKTVKHKNKNYRIPELTKGYIPQGLCTIGDYFVISAYKENGTDYSALFIIDKKTGKYIKKIFLPVVEHVGGVATAENRVLVTCSGEGTIGVLRLSDIEKAKKGEQVSFHQKIRIGNIGSFATYDGTYLWVGKYSSFSDGIMYGYKVKEVTVKKKIKKEVKKILKDGTTVIKTKTKIKTTKKLELTREYSLTIPSSIQGVTVLSTSKKGKRTFLFSQSGGRNRNSSLLMFKNISLRKNRTVNLKTASKTITIPPMAEGLLNGKNGYIYILFESGANIYSSNINAYCETPIYRMCYIKLSKLY